MVRFTLSGAQELDLAADGQVDLKLLGSLIRISPLPVSTTVHMTLGGSLRNPLPQGTIEVKNGAANYAGLPSGLSEMNGSLSFTRDRIHIEQLTARTGGGTLDLKGDATNYNQQLNFNLTAVGKGSAAALSAGRQFDRDRGVALGGNPLRFDGFRATSWSRSWR